MPKVFISHSSRDRVFVEKEILDFLALHDIATWYSKANIRSASQWEKSIREGLESCDWFLIALSPDSLTSRWAKAELEWAVEQRRDHIVPALIKTCDYKDFHLMLRGIQNIDFRKDREKARNALLDLLTREKPLDQSSILANSPDSPGGLKVLTGTTGIEILIGRDFDSYTDEEKDRLLSAIKEMLGVAGEIRVVSKRPGSVKLTLELTPEQAEKLVWAMKAGNFDTFGVVDANIVELAARTIPLVVSDEALLKQAVAGERESLDELFRRYRAVAYRVAHRLLGNEADALDAVQEAFLRALVHLPSFQERVSFKTWMLRVVSNAALDLGRRRRHETLSLDSVPEKYLEELHPLLTQNSGELSKKEFRRKLSEALNQLPIAQRQTFVLHAEAELSYREVAETLGVSIGTVMSRLYYARQRLRILLEPWVKTSKID